MTRDEVKEIGRFIQERVDAAVKPLQKEILEMKKQMAQAEYKSAQIHQGELHIITGRR